MKLAPGLSLLVSIKNNGHSDILMEVSFIQEK